MPVYKDQDRKTWYVKLQYKNWAGEPKWVTKRGFATKREATQWEQNFRFTLMESSDMPFDSFAQVYKRDREPRIKDSTFQMKEYIIDTKITPFFGKKPLREITTLDVMHWQNMLLGYRDPDTHKPYRKSYLKTIHNQLSAIFNHAVRFYKLKENPAALVGNMGTDKGITMNFWTKEEYQKFAEYMMDDPVGYYAFQVLYWCGLREGEMLALTPSDVNLENKTISVNKTLYRKNGKDIFTDPKTPKSNRTITMPDFLAEELNDYLAINPGIKSGDRMFPLSKNHLHYKMNRGSEATGVKRIRIHDLRHSHVSLLINLGFSAVAIADRMGHESIDITYRYAHLFPSVQAEMAERLNDLHAGDDTDV